MIWWTPWCHARFFSWDIMFFLRPSPRLRRSLKRESVDLYHIWLVTMAFVLEKKSQTHHGKLLAGFRSWSLTPCGGSTTKHLLRPSGAEWPWVNGSTFWAILENKYVFFQKNSHWNYKPSGTLFWNGMIKGSEAWFLPVGLNFWASCLVGTSGKCEICRECLQSICSGWRKLCWAALLFQPMAAASNVITCYFQKGGDGQTPTVNSGTVRTARFRGSALSVEPWATVWAPFHGWPGNVGQGSGSISRLVSLRFHLGVFNGFTCGFFIICKFSVGFLQNLFRVYWKFLSGMGFFTGVFMFKFTFYLGSLERWLMFKKMIIGKRKTRGPKNRLKGTKAYPGDRGPLFHSQLWQRGTRTVAHFFPPDRATVKPWRGGLRGGHRCRRHEAKAYKDRGGARGHRQIRGNTQLVKLTWTTSPMLE